MPCSATYLYIDTMIWLKGEVASKLKASYRNLSEGEKYDCALSTAPCESNLTKALVSLDPNKVFWSDLVLVYILLTPMFLVGMFGNICNIVILSKNNIASGSTNNLLLATSVSDLVYMLSVGVCLIHNYICFFDTALALTVYNLTTINNILFTKTVELLSLDLITVMAVQRAVAVVFPFKISQIFSCKNTNIIIALLVLMCLGIALPMNLSVTPQWMFHPYFGKRISLGYKLRMDFSGIFTFYYNIIYLCRSILDLSIIISAASVTVYKLKKHVENRSHLTAGTTPEDLKKDKSSMSDKEIKVVRMCSAVCYMSFAVYFVECAASVLVMLNRDQLFKSTTTMSLLFFAKSAGAVASSFNFVLYTIMSSQFRAAFFNIFRCRRKLK